MSLELTDAGFHYSILSEFRTRLVTGESGELLLETLPKQLVEAGLLKKRGQQRTDSVALLASVKALNQLIGLQNHEVAVAPTSSKML